MQRRRFLTTSGVAALGIGSAAARSEIKTLPALMPRDKSGHRFVLYSDCCSGSPKTRAGRNLQAVNAMVSRIRPRPEMIAFPGDAISGYTKDYKELRRQWDYWQTTEMRWVKQAKIPLYQSTSNHNTYDKESEAVFREAHPDLPRNGPRGQKGLAYWVRRGNMLYVSTHQPDRKMLIDPVWLDRVLTDNADVPFKFVAGHYPVFPVNGYEAYPQWCFPPTQRQPFWDVLVKHRVQAYLASHIIAFDVQVHRGVPQITSGGAGTNYGPGGFMPGRSEYLHAVQVAIDRQGLRYQVHDVSGRVRERLSWPLKTTDLDRWSLLKGSSASNTLRRVTWRKEIVGLRFAGRLSARPASKSNAQTLLCGIDSSEGVEPVWIGFDDSGRLIVRIVPVSGQGAQLWHGPLFKAGRFDFQLCLNPGMGPGGILFRRTNEKEWDSLPSSSSKGLEDLKTPTRWALGHAQSGIGDRPLNGESRITFSRVSA